MAEIIIGLLIALTSTAAIINAQSFPQALTPDVPGAAFFPTVVGVALIVASLGLVYKGIRGRQRFFAIRRDRNGYLAMAVTVLATIVFILLFGKTHFVLLTTVYITSLGILFGVPWKKALPSGIVSSTVVYLAFAKLLNVLLNG